MLNWPMFVKKQSLPTFNRGFTLALIGVDKFNQISDMVKVLLGEQMQTEVEPAMTIRDIATFLNVDEKTIYRLLTRGEFQGSRCWARGGFLRIETRKHVTKINNKLSQIN